MSWSPPVYHENHVRAAPAAGTEPEIILRNGPVVLLLSMLRNIMCRAGLGDLQRSSRKRSRTVWARQ